MVGQNGNNPRVFPRFDPWAQWGKNSMGRNIVGIFPFRPNHVIISQLTVVNLKLKVQYNTEKDVNLYVRKVTALALIPEQKVELVFSLMAADCPVGFPTLQTFNAYVQQYYIQGFPGIQAHIPPNYPV
jgi:hypothetical protein